LCLRFFVLLKEKKNQIIVFFPQNLLGVFLSY